MKKLGIIGSSDLALQIANIALRSDYSEVLCFADTPSTIKDKRIKIFGKVNDIYRAFENADIDEVAIGVGYGHFSYREKIYSELTENDVPIAIIIDPTCVIDPSAKIDEGAVIYPGVVIDMNVHIHANVLLNLNCVIAHDSEILAHSFLSPCVSIAGFCHIGRRNFLGINSTVIDGIKICDDVKVGAAALINKNIELPGTYVGNPAKVLEKG